MLEDALRGLTLLILIPLAVVFFQLAWTLLTASQSQQRKWRENYERKRYNRMMLKKWLKH